MPQGQESSASSLLPSVSFDQAFGTDQWEDPAVLMSPCNPSLSKGGLIEHCHLSKSRRRRVWPRPDSQQDSLAGPSPGVASAWHHSRGIRERQTCTVPLKWLCSCLGTNLASNTGLSDVLGNTSGTVTITWSVILLLAQIHPCHLHRITSMFSFSDSLEANFQNSLFMQLSEMTEVLGPFDQSLQYWEHHKSSLLMKHTFVPFPTSYTIAFWAEFEVSQEPRMWYTSLWFLNSNMKSAPRQQHWQIHFPSLQLEEDWDKPTCIAWQGCPPKVRCQRLMEVQ